MRRISGSELLDALERGELRVAERAPDGKWIVQVWVKEGLLSLFRESALKEFGSREMRELWPFVDKEAFPVRVFSRDARVRLVPGGSAVRRGAYVSPGTVLMPPCYVNVGAWIGEGSLVDSHVLVGSCAQIGARVHLSAGAQIGGVLEPPNAKPVIVEDEVFVGGQCGLYEGVLVRKRAVLAAGVVLTASTRVFDLVNECELAGGREDPLEIPENAVVVPGTRPAASEYARERGLSVACALIVKYRDERTDRATALEEALR